TASSSSKKDGSRSPGRTTSSLRGAESSRGSSKAQTAAHSVAGSLRRPALVPTLCRGTRWRRGSLAYGRVATPHSAQTFERVERLADPADVADRLGEPLHFEQLLDGDARRTPSIAGSRAVCGCANRGRFRPALRLVIFDKADEPQRDPDPGFRQL